jgi:hypothetical protein
MKFFKDAYLTLLPKFRVKDFTFSFHLGILFLNLHTADPGRMDNDYYGENLYMSKSSTYCALGIMILSLRGLFIPKRFVSY